MDGSRYTLFKTVINANRELSRTRYGPDALSLQIAQVGNDIKARQFLEEIDNHPEVGELVDCTSNYELEADEMMKANPPVDLTPELWLVKMLLGGIDDSYDAQDGACPSPKLCYKLMRMMLTVLVFLPLQNLDASRLQWQKRCVLIDMGNQPTNKQHAMQ